MHKVRTAHGCLLYIRQECCRNGTCGVNNSALVGVIKVKYVATHGVERCRIQDVSSFRSANQTRLLVCAKRGKGADQNINSGIACACKTNCKVIE